MTQANQTCRVSPEQQPAPADGQGADELLAIQPGHVMQREHYERLAREAAQK